MKALAAASIGQFENAVRSLDEYSRALMLGLRVLVKHGAFPREQIGATRSARVAAVVFGSDQGMCGQLNDRIVGHVMSEIESVAAGADDRMFLVAGQRAVAILENEGYRVDATVAVPALPEAITDAAQEIVMILDQWNQERGIGRVILYHNAHLSGASYRPRSMNMLPLSREWLEQVAVSKWPTNQIPFFTLDPGKLLSALTRQYIFVSLYRAFAHSLASENASRLAAMQGAERNIEEKQEELESEYHQRRQMEITEELLDIISGYDALTADEIG